MSGLIVNPENSCIRVPGAHKRRLRHVFYVPSLQEILNLTLKRNHVLSLNK